MCCVGGGCHPPAQVLSRHVGTLSRQPVPSSLRFLPFCVLGETMKAYRSLQPTEYGLRYPLTLVAKNSEVATLQLNTGGNWLSAS